METITVSTIAETIAEQVCDYRIDQDEHQRIMQEYRPAINKTQPEWHKNMYTHSMHWHERLQDRINAAVAVAEGLGIYREFSQHLEQLEEVMR